MADSGVEALAALHPEAEHVLSQLDELYEPVDGYGIARDVRKKMREDGNIAESVSLQYGEIDLQSFKSLLLDLPIADDAENLTIVDIGSGTGKPVFVAALHQAVAKSVGIEIVPELHMAAEDVKSKLPQWVENKCKLIKGDLFQHEQVWLDANVVYCPCTCFTEDMIKSLDDALSKTQPGTIVITTTRLLTNKDLRKKSTKRYRYKRGSLDFHVYVRKPMPLTPLTSGKRGARDVSSESSTEPKQTLRTE
jgi:SAM-dependent methyltransferase